MKRVIRALKTINYRLLAAILLMMFIPTVYQTVRIFFLGDMPGDWGFNIASQLSWVNLFYEVIQEALILPLFFLLGKSLKNKAELENKVRSGLIVAAIVYLLMSSVLIIFANPLVVFMAQDDVLVGTTVTYIRLETVAALFSTLWRFMLLVLVSLKKDKYMYIALTELQKAGVDGITTEYLDSILTVKSEEFDEFIIDDAMIKASPTAKAFIKVVYNLERAKLKKAYKDGNATRELCQRKTPRVIESRD